MAQTATPDRAKVLTDLAEANRQAKRQPHVLGTEQHPTAWDQWHEWIDVLLEDLADTPAT